MSRVTPTHIIPANPYPAAKEIKPLNTECETCKRIIPTKNWNEHARSKKHQKAEDAVRRAKDKENMGFSNDETYNNIGGPVGETPGNNDAGWGSTGNDGGFGGASQDNGGNDAGWGSTDNDGGFGGASQGSGGRGSCYRCGMVGHNQRDW